MKSLKIFNFTLIALFSITANAGLMKVGHITAVLTGQKTAEIQLDEGNTHSADTLFIGSKQANCEVKVKKSTPKIILVDISNCDDKTTYAVDTEAFVYSEEYAVTDELQSQPTPDPVPVPAPSQYEKPPKEQFTFLGGGLRANNSLIFENTRATDGTDFAISDLKYEADSPPLFLELNHISARQNSWGWMAGVSYWTVKWDTVSGFGDTLNLNSTESTILNIYGSAAYRFTNGFIHFGLNGSSIRSKNSPFLEASKGAMGGQLGGGVFLSDTVMLAIESRAISYGSISYREGTSSLVADSAGFYSGLNLGLYLSLN